MIYLIYPAAKATDIAEAVQPMAGYEGVGPCLLGTPAESADGLYAHAHPWSGVETDFLEARISGITGAYVAESLPVGWKPKADG